MSKTVVISGASGSLGVYVVKKFLDAGWQVEALCQQEKSQQRWESHPRLSITVADLSFENETQNTVTMLIDKYNSINACVMLAGGFTMSNFNNTDYELIQRMLHLNFFTAFHLVSGLYAHMTQQPEGGKMIFIGAKTVLHPKSGLQSIAYTLSKSLLFKLSELINADGNDKGVRSTVIVPSIIDTPANRAAMPDADFNQWVRPEKIAEVICDFCQDKIEAKNGKWIEMFSH